MKDLALFFIIVCSFVVGLLTHKMVVSEASALGMVALFANIIAVGLNLRTLGNLWRSR